MAHHSKPLFSKLVFALSLLYLILYILSIVLEARAGITSLNLLDTLAYSAVFGLILITTAGCFCYMTNKVFGWAIAWKVLALLWVLLILGSCWALFYDGNYTTSEASMIALLVAIILLPITYALWDYGNILGASSTEQAVR